MYEKNKKSILMVGPLIKDPLLAGGMLIEYQTIIEQLEEFNVDFKVIDTNSQVYKNIIHLFSVFTVKLLKNIHKYDHIHIHATANHLVVLGSISVFLGKIFKKSVSVKKTAGRFNREYEKFDPIRKKLTQYVLKNADTIFFETKYLVEYFKNFNKNTYWIPNCRKDPKFKYKSKTYSKRFAFISLIAEQKGMDILLEASNKLDNSYTIDVYGKSFEEKYTKEYFDNYKANLKGPLDANKVLDTLKEYDVVVLPSFEEGYPGIFLEAFSVGVPVLATNLQPIQEIIEDGKNGILVNVGNVDDLYQGFLSFSEKDYEQMRKNAYDSFSMFNAFNQTKKFIDFITAPTN
jgi:glycosyltransferase involved in cell wall biosynthesis